MFYKKTGFLYVRFVLSLQRRGNILIFKNSLTCRPQRPVLGSMHMCVLLITFSPKLLQCFGELSRQNIQYELIEFFASYSQPSFFGISYFRGPTEGQVFRDNSVFFMVLCCSKWLFVSVVQYQYCKSVLINVSNVLNTRVNFFVFFKYYLPLQYYLRLTIFCISMLAVSPSTSPLLKEGLGGKGSGQNSKTSNTGLRSEERSSMIKY